MGVFNGDAATVLPGDKIAGTDGTVQTGQVGQGKDRTGQDMIDETRIDSPVSRVQSSIHTYIQTIRKDLIAGM